jgi:hypothetical protein
VVIARDLDIPFLVDPADVRAVGVMDASGIAEPAPRPAAQRPNLGCSID